MSIFIIGIAKNIINEKYNKAIWYNLVFIIIYALILCLVFSKAYFGVQVLIELLILSICLRYLFNIKLLTAFVASIMSNILLMIFGLIVLINVFIIQNASIFDAERVVINLSVLILTYLFTKIHFVRSYLNKLVTQFENKPSKLELVVLCIFMTILVFFYYKVFTEKYIFCNSINFIIFIAVLSFILFIYLNERLKYSRLINKYNSIFEYACAFEEELEKDRLLQHEHKNQLAVIKGMTKDKKVNAYIDEILDSYNKENDYKDIRGLSNLPRGGLRGVIYYKLCVMKRAKIDFSLDVSKTVKKKLANLSIEEIKMISYIIGVCSDNAIEECSKNKNSNISIEIYDLDDEISIIMSNTIFSKINFKKIGNKGYSTKGTGRGNGLFLINRMLKKYDNITMKVKVINNYYVQEIKIKF